MFEELTLEAFGYLAFWRAMAAIRAGNKVNYGAEPFDPSGAVVNCGIHNVPLRFQLGELQLAAPTIPLKVFEFEPGTAPAGDWFRRLADSSRGGGFFLKGVPLPLDPCLCAPRPGWMSRTVRRYPRHLISLSQGFDDYMAKFSAKTRSTLRRKMRRFAERSGGEIRWEEFRTRADLARFFPPAAALSAKTYQERLLHAGLPDSKTFVKSAFESADHGRVRAYLLYLDDCPVAYMYLPIENGRVVYAHLGYDPSFARYSPGTVLQLLVLQKLFEDPAAKVFDFTEGAGAHKELFATHKVECADVVLAPRRWTTNALLSGHAAFAATERTLVALLDRIGIKRNLKRLLRRH